MWANLALISQLSWHDIHIAQKSAHFFLFLSLHNRNLKQLNDIRPLTLTLSAGKPSVYNQHHTQNRSVRKRTIQQLLPTRLSPLSLFWSEWDIHPRISICFNMFTIEASDREWGKPKRKVIVSISIRPLKPIARAANSNMISSRIEFWIIPHWQHKHIILIQPWHCSDRLEQQVFIQILGNDYISLSQCGLLFSAIWIS